TRIERPGKSLLGSHAHVEAALRTHIQCGHKILMENHLAAPWTFGPEVFRRFAAPGYPALDLRTNEVGDPVHAPTLAHISGAPHVLRPRASDRNSAFRKRGFRGCRHSRHFSPPD